MGIRHLQGVLSIPLVLNVTILDINSGALNNAREAANNDERLTTKLITNFTKDDFDICIIASTAQNRKELINLAVSCKCKYLMIEKPLGQSYEEVVDLIKYVERLPIITVVNLNMRQYPCVIKLKNDLASITQLKGMKTITINTGALGIGCNGIHYLDKLFYLLDADDAKIVAAEIDDSVIPSGRGVNFCDFGGWAVIKFYKNGNCVAKVLMSMASDSSAFGGCEIIAPQGRIVVDEIAGYRRTTLRKIDSTLPVYRYASDYLEPVCENYIAPFLGDLTASWVYSLIEGKNELPLVRDSQKAHKLLFEWLSFSKKYSKIFPIT